jgi:hypothetical protein
LLQDGQHGAVLLAASLDYAHQNTLRLRFPRRVLLPPQTLRAIVEHAEWEDLAEKANGLRAQVERGIDGEKSQEIVELRPAWLLTPGGRQMKCKIRPDTLKVM